MFNKIITVVIYLFVLYLLGAGGCYTWKIVEMKKALTPSSNPTEK